MINLNVNGESRQYEGDGDMPLLWYLRDLLNLTGTKYSCGKGLCGSCTVHLNGTAVRSCVTTMAAADGGEVTTIEGLATDGDHPLQVAWAKHDVPQCGYCQPGQIMQAASLLAANPSPSDDEIKDEMEGVICRCGTYLRIEKAIKSVAGGES
jgi:aerobic-type carbon monoxide dehydrogenase small subunit (CoxS/CutS family)